MNKQASINEWIEVNLLIICLPLFRCFLNNNNFKTTSFIEIQPINDYVFYFT